MTSTASAHRKLTPAQQGEIAALYAAGDATQAELANRFSVSVPTVVRAIREAGARKGELAAEITRAAREAHEARLVATAREGDAS
jgi:transposase-like protein